MGDGATLPRQPHVYSMYCLEQHTDLLLFTDCGLKLSWSTFTHRELLQSWLPTRLAEISSLLILSHTIEAILWTPLALYHLSIGTLYFIGHNFSPFYRTSPNLTNVIRMNESSCMDSLPCIPNECFQIFRRFVKVFKQTTSC